MTVEFKSSPRSSVGVEWELALVDAETLEFAPRADEVLARLGADDQTGPIRREYFLHMIELVSGAHATVGEAVADLRTSLDAVRAVASELGLRVIGSGTHPFSPDVDLPVYDAPRPRRVREQNGYWARQITISGTHVHVGIANVDHAIPVTQALTRVYPYLLALSASSPFFHGEDTAFASQRTMLFQQLPTNGLPPAIHAWHEYEDYAAELAAVGMIAEAQEIRWDVRPAPRFGTVENRAMDSVPTLAEVACLAALAQCFVELAVREIDLLDILPPWLVSENKWRAARYGLDADVIIPRYYSPRIVPLRDGLRQWVEILTPVARDLGCADELAFTGELIAGGPSYLRQRRVAAASGGDLHAVVLELCAELEDGLPRFR